MKRPTHRIVIHKTGKYWTSTIYSGKKILWSSTSQLYSRKIDAVRAAKRFWSMAAAGRIEIVS
jgi:hypothetical protein